MFAFIFMLYAIAYNLSLWKHYPMNGTINLNLDHLRAFSEVAKHANFRAAAAALNMPPATLSRHIRDLEGQLGERLLNRTTRKVQLTGSGARLLESIADSLAQIDSACQDFGDDHTATRGPVYIATNTALAEMLIVPVFSYMNKKYPDISIELKLDADIVNLRDEGVDFALRAGNVEGEAQVRKKIARHHFVQYAAAHVARPELLPLTAYDREQPGAEKAAFFAKDGLLMKQMLLDGIVTGLAPDALMLPLEKSGKLKRLTNSRSLGFDIFICYPERGHLIPRARLVMDEISSYAKACQIELEGLLPPKGSV
jgi:DNA-binding transcriptional LysR family regulator